MKRLSTLLFVAFPFTLTALAHEIDAEQSLRKAVATIGEKKPDQGTLYQEWKNDNEVI